MTQYELVCKNELDDEDCLFVIFSKPRFDMGGFNNVVIWQNAYVERECNVPLHWNVEYGVSLCDLDEETRVYWPRSEVVNVNPEKEYQVIDAGHYSFISREPSGNSSWGLVSIRNNTSNAYNVAFTNANKVAMVERVVAHGSCFFSVPLAYYVSCSRPELHLRDGQAIYDNMFEVSYQMVEYNDTNKKTAVLKRDDSGRKVLTIQ